MTVCINRSSKSTSNPGQLETHNQPLKSFAWQPASTDPESPHLTLVNQSYTKHTAEVFSKAVWPWSTKVTQSILLRSSAKQSNPGQPKSHNTYCWGLLQSGLILVNQSHTKHTDEVFCKAVWLWSTKVTPNILMSSTKQSDPGQPRLDINHWSLSRKRQNSQNWADPYLLSNKNDTLSYHSRLHVITVTCSDWHLNR